MKKTLLIIFVTILLISVYLLISSNIKHRNEITKFSELINKEQGLTELLLKIPNASMSFGDVFKRCEVASIENDSIFTTIGVYHLDNDLNDSIKEYLSVSNDLASNLKFCYKEIMQADNFIESINSDYSYLYYWNTEYFRQKYINSLEAARHYQKYIEHREKFIENYKILLRMEIKLSSIMNNSGIKFTKLYSKYKDVNLTEAEILSENDSNYTRYYNIGLPYINDIVRYYNLDKWEAQSDTQSSIVFKNYKYKLTQFSTEQLNNEIHRRAISITAIKANSVGNIQFIFTIVDKNGVIISKNNSVYMNKNKETGEFIFTIPQ